MLQKLHKTKSQARKTQTQAQNTKLCHLCAGEVEPGGAGVAQDKITSMENTNTKHKKKLCQLCAGEVEPGGAGVARDRGQRVANVV